jgi:hypothetical protein
VDSKKIEAIEVMCRWFLKSLLGVRKTTSTSIMLAEFGKFPFEHFAWGQALMYYNRVSMITKDRILRKAWEAQLTMLATGKKCWAGSMKQWLFRNQPQEVAGFLPLVQPSLEMAPQLVATHALHAMTTQPINQEVRVPPPPGFPHTTLNVKRVKANMWLAFIEKLFTNREIGTSMQTRYLRFKGMSYENKSHLCDINCVQLRKTVA